MKKFNVLSLFDGCSCAMIALNRLGIKPDNYFASEIDKYAIQVSKANWPEIKHIGDVSKVHYFERVLYTEFGSYEVSFANGLVCGGSPCQGFSFAGKQLNFEDPRSKLFFEFVRIYEEIKAEHPQVKVFLENVVMKKEYQAVISEKLGLQPILINSALVSAQNRKRLYWTNIPFQGQPADRGILLKHILENSLYEQSDLLLSSIEVERAIEKAKGKVWNTGNRMGNMDFPNNPDKKTKSLCAVQIKGSRETNHIGVIRNRGKYYERNEKSMCICASYYKGADNHGQRTLIQVVSLTERRTEEAKEIRRESMKSGRDFSPRRGKELVERIDDKANCLTATQSIEQTLKITCEVLTEDTESKVVGEAMISYRKLTPVECERLQCIEDNYTRHVSNSQRYRMLGNGWNVETIVHLFEPLLYADIL